jgi:polyisoprenoid-binding protein YceI
MRTYVWNTAVLGTLVLSGAATPARAADNYTIDPDHSSITFKVEHLGIAWIHGRFNDLSGSFTLDRNNPGKSSFDVTIKVDSLDTNNKKRDEHLRGPDFFNAKQFPVLTFKSTGVKSFGGGYDVTGDLTLHGVTKPIVFTLKGGKEAEFPKGKKRTGFSADVMLKRSTFGMDKGVGPIGDEVRISISFEGVKK